MPNLLFFAPCEKFIVDQSNNLSLITILEEVKIQLVGNVAVQPGTIAPMHWGIATLWEQASAWDQNRTFEQRAALISESGIHLIEALTTWVFERPRQRNLNQILGLPISAPGPHKIKLWIREKVDPPREWREVATFPLLIDLLPGPPPESASSPLN